MRAMTLSADDATLVRGLKAGEEAAAAALLERYWDRAYRTAFHITNDPAAAEDVTQETFVQVLRRVQDLEDGARFRAWFFRVLENTSRNQVRSRRRRTSHEERARPRRDEPPVEDAAVTQEQVRLVREQVERLGDKQRLALSLRYLEGLSLSEVAQALDVPEGTASSRIRLGLDALRRSLPPALAGVAALPGTEWLTAALRVAAPPAPAPGALAPAATPPLTAGRRPASLLAPALVSLLALGAAAAALWALVGEPGAAPDQVAAAPAPAPGSAPPEAGRGTGPGRDTRGRAPARSVEGAAAAPPAGAAAPVATGTLCVEVVDVEGRPVAGAELYVRVLDAFEAEEVVVPLPRWPDAAPRVRTDDAGVARPAAPRGAEAFVFAQRGLDEGRSERFTVTDATVRVTLVPPDRPAPGRGALLGRVRRGGHLVRGAQLEVRGWRQASTPWAWLRQVDGEGRYALRDIEPGEYRLAFTVGSLTLRDVDLVVRPDEVTRFDVDLRAGAAVVGRVVLPRGFVPRPDAMALLLVIGERMIDQPLGLDGRYRIEGLVPGTYGLVALLEGFGPRRCEVVAVEDQEVTAPDLRFEGGARVSGRVLARDGRPFDGAFAQLDQGPLHVEAPADAQGRFELQAVQPGEYELRLYHRTGRGTWRDGVERGVRVEAQDVDLGDLLLDAEPRRSGTQQVAGRVLGPDGRPAAGARVRVGPTDPVDADAAGELRVDLPYGTHALTARAPGGLTTAAPLEVLVTDAPPAPLTVQLVQGGVVAGVVLAPAARLQGVRAFRVSLEQGPRFVAHGPVDGAGRFRLPAVPPGRYTLVLHAAAGESSFPERQEQVEVRAGATTAIELDLSSATETVRVRWAGGRPGSVTARWTTPEGRPGSAVSDAWVDGGTRLDFVQPGPVTVELIRWRDTEALVLRRRVHVVRGVEATVELPALEGGEVRGRVAPGARVAAQRDGDPDLELRLEVGAGDDGAFRLAGLPAGRYRVYTGPTGQWAPGAGARVELRPGDVATLPDGSVPFVPARD